MGEFEFVRHAAIEALGKLDDASVIPVLAEALKNKDKRICMAAAKALGERGNSLAVPALLDIRDNEKRFFPLDAEAACKSSATKEMPPDRASPPNPGPTHRRANALNTFRFSSMMTSAAAICSAEPASSPS